LFPVNTGFDNMKNKNNLLSPSLLFLLAILFLSCKNKPVSNSDNELQNNALIEKNEDTDDNTNLQNYKVKQLNDSTFILTPSDTVSFQKPFLKLFKGAIDGKDIQIWIHRSFELAEGMLSSSFPIDGIVYMDGFEDIAYFSFNNNEQKLRAEVYADDEKENHLFDIEYGLGNDNIIVKKNSDKYVIQEADFRFTAYDKFEYVNTYCPEKEAWSHGLNQHWSYSFSYVIDKCPQAYRHFFREALVSDKKMYNPEDIKKWKHDIQVDVVSDLPAEDEDICFPNSDQSYLMPVYLDSLLYIVRDNGHVYMGGAHGMFSIEYYCYNIKTGEIIKLEDILDTETDAFQEYHYKKLKENLYPGDDDFLGEHVEMPSTFYILPSGICLIYPPYSLKGGFWQKYLFLPMDELGPFFKKRYYY